MAQIINITSEALQATIRRLLPSQQGFGEDLQATNVVTPIIDLTPTAEGSALPTNLANSLAFGSQTGFDITNTTTVLANTAGFWRFVGTGTILTTSGGARAVLFTMTDGATTKTVWQCKAQAISSPGGYDGPIPFDLVFYLNSGESISGTASTSAVLTGSYRQIADVNGNIINPSGFVQQ